MTKHFFQHRAENILGGGSGTIDRAQLCFQGFGEGRVQGFVAGFGFADHQSLLAVDG